MTIYLNTGISIHALTSILTAQTEVANYTDQISGYSHQIDADGGYRKASITLNLSQQEVEDWYENGLMRHIIVYNEGGIPIWEGFVNSVSLSIGGLQITRGPVLSVVNRLSVTYTRLDTSVDPPVSGGESITPIQESASSQALYGVLERVISGGQITDADALQIRSTYLYLGATPAVSQSLALSSGSVPIITLDCAGYVEYLDRFIYDASSTSTITVSAKILAILAARPNAIISTDYIGIATNAMLTPAVVNNQGGLSVIKSLVALGDINYNRYIFGVLAGRKAYYRAIPTTYDYEYSLIDNEVRVYGSGPIYPWNIQAGKWLFYPDFLIGRGKPDSSSFAAFRSDPRSHFIESVSYTAPFGLTLQGGRSDRLTQKLAQYGLGGL